MTPDNLAAILPPTGTTHRLDLLLQLRAFITEEIAAERRRLATSPEWAWVEAAADLYGLDPSTLLSDARHKSVVKARQIAAWLMREDGLSYPTIGRALNRDHTTAIHSVRCVERDQMMRTLARQLREQGAGEVA